MPHPSARLRAPNGLDVTLRPGDLVGRAATAALHLPDARVSEAHALVSLRGNELHLLALRGRVELDGETCDDVPLAAGQRIRLGDAVDLVVEAVSVPDRILAVALGEEAPRELWAPVYSVVLDPVADLVPRYVEDAAARLWSTSEGWKIQLPESRPETIHPGGEWSIRGHTLRAVQLAVTDAAIRSTAGGSALELVVRTTTVHVLRAGRAPAILDGQPGRLVTELALMRRPAPWEALARELWPDVADRHRSRRRLDRVVERLRGALRECGLREDLVRYDGAGNVELLLFPGDRVRDEA